MIDNQKLIEDFQRAFKFSRFEEQKTFGDARNEAIAATCALHGGSIHDHAETFDKALRDLCVNHKDLWVNDVRAEDNRWFQYYEKQNNE